jgi:hypothetical protein
MKQERKEQEPPPPRTFSPFYFILCYFLLF